MCQVEEELVMMIASGSITATISQQDGMVRFDTSPASYSSPDMLALLEGGVTAAITLDRQVLGAEKWATHFAMIFTIFGTNSSCLLCSFILSYLMSEVSRNFFVTMS